MKAAVIGAKGQLGSDIVNIYQADGHEVVELDIDTNPAVDITNFDLLKDALSKLSPDLVINTAAVHDVEVCENNPKKAFEVNATGAWNIAKLSKEMGFKFLHISTDYVFDGAKKAPYTEEDMPMPLNAYGNTKLSGEYFALTTSPKCFVARVSGLYGNAPCRGKRGGLNFVKLMLKLAKERDEVRVVNDEILTPTWTRAIAKQCAALTDTEHYGLYHMTCEGLCSWYEFTKKIFELRGIKTKLSIASPDEFPAKTPRPKYSVLENKNLKKLGLNSMPKWDEALEEYLSQFQE